MSRQTQKEVGRLPVGLFSTRFVTGFLLAPAFFWIVPGICTPTAMAGPRGGQKSANTLLVLRVAGDPVGRRQEQRFVTELRLALAAHLARFQAAVLLQDRMGRHRAAAALLRDYLNRRGGLDWVPRLLAVARYCFGYSPGAVPPAGIIT